MVDIWSVRLDFPCRLVKLQLTDNSTDEPSPSIAVEAKGNVHAVGVSTAQMDHAVVWTGTKMALPDGLTCDPSTIGYTGRMYNLSTNRGTMTSTAAGAPDDPHLSSVAQHQRVHEMTQSRVLSAYGKVPLHFVANQGQMAPSVYNHGLRDDTDRSSACVGMFIRVSLESVVIKEAKRCDT